MKTVIFARLSAQEQEAEGHSIDAQTAKLREYLQRNNLEIEHLKKMKKLKNNPKYKFIMSQMTDENLVNKVFEVMSREV